MSNALRIGNRSINAAAVSLEDQLSDHIYHYDGKDKVFEKEWAYAQYRTEREQMRNLANARRNVEMILQNDDFARTTKLITK